MSKKKKHECPLCPARYTSKVNLRAHRAAQHAEALLGLATTEELLVELRVRGDVALVAYPGTEVAADGVILTALAEACIRALGRPTLDYRSADSLEDTSLSLPARSPQGWTVPGVTAWIEQQRDVYPRGAVGWNYLNDVLRRWTEDNA